MNWIQKLDATVLVALIGLAGTIFTIQYNKKSKEQDAMIQANEQLINVIETLSNEIRILKEQHSNESRRLEEKIIELTTENQQLRDDVNRLNNYLIKLGISV